MALNKTVSLFGCLVARSGRKRGNRQTDGRNDKPSTITLTADALRGLIIRNGWLVLSFPHVPAENAKPLKPLLWLGSVGGNMHDRQRCC